MHGSQWVSHQPSTARLVQTGRSAVRERVARCSKAQLMHPAAHQAAGSLTAVNALPTLAPSARHAGGAWPAAQGAAAGHWLPSAAAACNGGAGAAQGRRRRRQALASKHPVPLLSERSPRAMDPQTDLRLPRSRGEADRPLGAPQESTWPAERASRSRAQTWAVWSGIDGIQADSS